MVFHLNHAFIFQVAYFIMVFTSIQVFVTKWQWQYKKERLKINCTWVTSGAPRLEIIFTWIIAETLLFKREIKHEWQERSRKNMFMILNGSSQSVWWMYKLHSILTPLCVVMWSSCWGVGMDQHGQLLQYST